LTKLKGHSIRGQTRSQILLKWSNNTAIVAESVFFRYYKGAGWVGPVSTKRRVVKARAGEDIAGEILKRIALYEADGYSITKRLYGDLNAD